MLWFCLTGAQKPGHLTEHNVGRPGGAGKWVLLTITSELLEFQASQKAFFAGNNWASGNAVGNIFQWGFLKFTSHGLQTEDILFPVLVTLPGLFKKRAGCLWPMIWPHQRNLTTHSGPSCAHFFPTTSSSQDPNLRASDGINTLNQPLLPGR